MRYLRLLACAALVLCVMGQATKLVSLDETLLFEQLGSKNVRPTLWGYVLGASLKGSKPTIKVSVSEDRTAEGQEVTAYPMLQSSAYFRVLADQSGIIRELRLVPSPIAVDSLKSVLSERFLRVLHASEQWTKEWGDPPTISKKQILEPDETRNREA